MMARIVASTAVLLATLATAGDCSITGEDSHPNAPQAPGPSRGGPPVPQPTNPEPAPGDPKPHTQKDIIVRAGGFKAEYLPYQVDIYATGGIPPITHDPVAGGDYTRTIHYDEQRGVTVHVIVRPSRQGSTAGYCGIEGGGKHDGPRFIAGEPQLDCYLTINPKK